MSLQSAHDGALRMIEQREPLRRVLSHLASSAEELCEHRIVASILLLDRDGLLRNGASPNLPADYLDAIDRLKPDANIGTCAAAAATGLVVCTPDFLEDSRWAELKHLPLALGFRGAWSMPIKGHAGRVLGTFGSYFFEQRNPTAREQEVVSRCPARRECDRGVRDGGLSDPAARDAESLMRSRHAAYVALDREWLLATWHPSTRPRALELDPSIKWLGLDVKSHRVIGRCLEESSPSLNAHGVLDFALHNMRSESNAEYQQLVLPPGRGLAAHRRLAGPVHGRQRRP